MLRVDLSAVRRHGLAAEDDTGPSVVRLSAGALVEGDGAGLVLRNALSLLVEKKRPHDVSASAGVSRY